jgi:hypothetical protein
MVMVCALANFSHFFDTVDSAKLLLSQPLGSGKKKIEPAPELPHSVGSPSKNGWKNG